MDMRAVNPALKRRPVAFHGVRARAERAVVLPGAVVDGDVLVAKRSDLPVAAKFVRADFRARQDRGVNHRFHRLAVTRRDHLCGYLAAALNHADHGGVVGLITRTFAGTRATDQRFVNFHVPSRTAEQVNAINFAHILPDHVAHAPSGLVRHAKLALDFLGRHAIPRCAELEHYKEPIAQRRAGAIKRRSCGRVNLVGAPLALVRAATSHAAVAGIAKAPGAVEVSAVPDLEHVIQTAFLGREALLKLAKGGGFVAHSDRMPHALTCRKGIITKQVQGNDNQACSSRACRACPESVEAGCACLRLGEAHEEKDSPTIDFRMSGSIPSMPELFRISTI